MNFYFLHESIIKNTGTDSRRFKLSPANAGVSRISRDSRDRRGFELSPVNNVRVGGCQYQYLPGQVMGGNGG